MADYRIVYVDDELIDGRDFVLCNRHADGIVLCMNKRVRDLSDEENVAVWEDAWRAFREMAQVEEIPEQRAYVHSI